MRNKLTYIAHIRLPTDKAHGVQIMKMCEAFAKGGADVTLVVPDKNNPVVGDPFDFYSIPKGLFHIKRLWCPSLLRFGWIGFWLESLAFTERAAWYALLNNGVFYTRDPLIALFLKSMGKQVTWEVHTKQTNALANITLRIGVPLVVVTQGLKDFYITRGVPAKHIAVAHDAVDPNMFKDVPSKGELRATFGISREAFVVSYIGKYSTMGKSKGVEDIIDPFIALHKKHPKSFLLIVGPNPSEIAELRDILQSKGVSSDSYKLVGHVPYVTVAGYMKASDALLMVYPDTEHYRYFMSPLKLFEYMASGVPIVTTDLPAVREVLNEESAYFFVGPQNLERVLVEIEEKPEAATMKADKAKEIVSSYSWEARAKHIRDTFAV